MKRFSLTAVLLLMACVRPSPGPRLDLPPEVANEKPDHLERHSKTTMGTLVEIALPRTRAGPERQAALTAAWDAFAFVEREMNEWREDSPLSAVNRAAGGAPVVVGPELFDLLSLSLEFARQSDGAFDPTWAGMRGVWKFGSAQDGTVPSPEQIAAKRALIRYQDLELDHEHRTARLLRSGMALGLGGIAKGYAVDRAAAALRAAGEPDFLIEAGGELYAAGRPNPAGAWQAGIRDPRGEGAFAFIELHDEACSTSGDYERAFIKDGIRYHHIIDPRTGEPARASRSVTIVAKHAVETDALTKVAFILGADRAFPIVRKHNAKAVVVTGTNDLRFTEGFEPEVKVLHSPTDTSP